MKINGEEVSIEELLQKEELNPQNYYLKKIGNLYLSNQDIELLEECEVPYQKCKNMKELLFLIESYHLEELEELSSRISEFCYYHETNK